MFPSVLIANRGEIACRIIRTATAMGLRTVAVYSDADAGAAHVRAADEAIRIGPAPAAESYLRGEAIIAAARASGVAAIHPGYGFLSENAGFAEAVTGAGLIFVGPPPAAMRAMGPKDASKRLIQAAGVPVVPGYHDQSQDNAVLAAAAEKIGYPVLIKAVLGGGGKGMRRVDEPDEFNGALIGARREAQAAFGDDRVIIERFIVSPRHIEVQVFADAHGNYVHLYERDCTLQRRHQKVIEEAPAPGMTVGLRSRMTDAALKAAKAVDYVGAGTVEFILDGGSALADDTQFFFMEMNTRLQVEHPVTEMVTGYDLVEWQLRVAAGEFLPVFQDGICLKGCAVEARLYAENPVTGFLPSTGPVLRFRAPAGAAVRVDAGVAEGDEVTPHYDPMLAKVIAHGATRDQALHRLDNALARLEFAGPDSNQAFLRALLVHQDFVSVVMDTGLIDRELPEITTKLAAQLEALVPAAVQALLAWPQAGGAAQKCSAWAVADGFQLGPGRREARPFLIDGEVRKIEIAWANGIATTPDLTLPQRRPGIVAAAPGVIAVGGGHQLSARLADPFGGLRGEESGGGSLAAPMPGLVTSVEVTEGETVRHGQLLVVLEAMKMEHAVKAPFDGTVTGLLVPPGSRVAQGDALVVIEALAHLDRGGDP